MSGAASGGGLPLDEWLARYDDALLRGETPPDLADAQGPDADRLRDFLDMLDRTLRPRGSRSSGPDREEAGPLFESVGRFLIEEELGRGGFGVVFRAIDPTIGRQVALKVPRVDVLADPDVRRRFLREAHAAAQLDHPNLVPVFEVGEAAGTCYIASAYCVGPTLRRWMEEGRAPAEPRAAARLALSLARAVEHMHARGLLHCDLKPGNVLLDLPPEGGEPTPRVTDFGLARLADAPAGESTAARAWGTPPYMAPEQIEMRREAIGPPTDVYALGVILYELLIGRPPHRGETPWELMRGVVSVPPTPPRRLRRAIPRDLDAIAMRCLEKRPDRRYPDASALAEDLVRFLGRLPTVARPLGRARRLARWSARNPAATALMAMGAATLAVSIGYSTALRRAVDDLNRANAEARAAQDRAVAQADRERKAHYVATLSLAQQDLEAGRDDQAQRLLREMIPGDDPGGVDRRDFAWHYLWRQSRRRFTFLEDLAYGGTRVSSAGGVLLSTSHLRGGGLWRVVEPVGDRHPAAVRPDYRFVSITPPSSAGLGAVALPGGRLGAVSRQVGPSRTLSILDLAGGRILGTVEDAKLAIDEIAVAGDGERLAVGVEFRPAGARSLTRRPIDIEGRQGSLYGVPGGREIVFSGDGTRIASFHASPRGDLHRILRLWDVEAGSRLPRHYEGCGPALAASPLAGGPIATGTPKGEVQLRDPKDGRLLASLPAPQRDRDHVACLAFSRDGKTLAAGYNKLAILWDVEGRREVSRIEGLSHWTESIAFLDGSGGDVAIGLTSGEVVIWHAVPIEPAVALRGHEDQVWGVGYVDGRGTIATVGGDKLLKLWDAETGAEVASLSGHRDWPSCLASTSSGPLAVTGDFGGEVLVWDVAGRRMARRLKSHEGRVRAVAVSPDGRRVAAGGDDRRVRIWDAESGALIGALEGHVKKIRGLAFRDDGRRLASTDEAGGILLWDVEARSECGRMDGSANVSSVAWSPDGRLLATGDTEGAAILWDVERQAALVTLPWLHRQAIDGLAFSPDGRILAAGGQDGLITLVDVATGRRHLTLAGHEGGVNALAFSPDGRTLASASHDKTVRLWWAGPAETSTLPGAASGL